MATATHPKHLRRATLAKGAIILASLAPLLRHATPDASMPMVVKEEDLPRVAQGPPARVLQEELAYAIVVGTTAVALLL